MQLSGSPGSGGLSRRPALAHRASAAFDGPSRLNRPQARSSSAPNLNLLPAAASSSTSSSLPPNPSPRIASAPPRSKQRAPLHTGTHNTHIHRIHPIPRHAPTTTTTSPSTSTTIPTSKQHPPTAQHQLGPYIPVPPTPTATPAPPESPPANPLFNAMLPRPTTCCNRSLPPC